jgi:signal transduction histidine kinase
MGKNVVAVTIEKLCPRCGKPVTPEARTCPNCGIDQDLAAILAAEQSLTAIKSIPSGTPIAPEILVPRLGEILLERGVITSEELERALHRHNELASHGKQRLLGQIILELGLIDQETLDQVITGQILQLQAALERANRQLEERVKERTTDLQNALDKLSELNQLKSNFISNISHELRTPLTHIKGYLDLLSDGSLGTLTPMQKEALAVLMRSELRLERLIEDLLLFSFAAKGEFTLKKVRASVNNLITSSVSRVENLANAKRINIEVSIIGELPQVYVDTEKITWAILQLLDNAIKFTPQGGDVRVKVEADKNFVIVDVEDNGIGIAPERINEIFEAFHQLDGAETRRYSGTGLGLALVRQIVEAHGSLIKVRSAPGQGSSFEFTLPAIKDGNA